MTTYSDIILATPGLTNYWRLGDASGTTAVAAHGSIAGTIAGTPTLGATGLLTGDADKAITFDGTDDVIACGGNSDMAGVASMSLEVWVKTTTPGASYRGIFVKNSSYGILTNANQLIVYDWGAGADRATGVNINDGATRHIVASFRSGVASGSFVAVNGVAVWTGTYTVGLGLTNPLRIGGNTAGQFFNGTIDEAAVYNVALDIATIQQHYNAGLGIFPAPVSTVFHLGSSYVGPLKVGQGA